MTEVVGVDGLSSGAWRLEGAVRAVAGEVRSAADELRAAAAVDWESLAAEAFRAELAAEVTRVLAVASALDEAAGAVARHARAVADGGLLGRFS
ncbi:hypothetical protein ACIB24_02600 [Spongisporangium articulatum]|uniref:ESAT-6-like protein n=1 Tax=Spongisporangium articulatum TaxID=3362603 RepID=A0ABW8AHV7_9ACTN